MSKTLLKPRVVITGGDPCGIGLEIIEKALSDKKIFSLASYVLIADKQCIKRKSLIKKVEFIDVSILKRPPFLGRYEKSAAKVSFVCIEKACDLIKARQADCMVTAPVNKEAINRCGISFKGHTEYLAQYFNVRKYLMMLVNGVFRVSIVTRHIPLREVAGSLSVQNISDTVKLTVKGLKDYFAIKSPKIAVSALNPHAAEGNVLGKEELKKIIPAIKKLRLKNISGPFPADSLFNRKGFDAFVAMYHDQGLIPIKQNNFFNCVNLTIGLPFIRTSPGHGTAYEIAGKTIADARSMKNAIYLAISAFRKKCR